MHGDEELYLRPKTFATLVYLIERRGHLVTKNELLDKIWPDIIVTEATLAHCIEEIRKVLGDNAFNPCFLKTISRLGYKFIARVQELPASIETETEIEEYTEVRIRLEKEPVKNIGSTLRFSTGLFPLRRVLAAISEIFRQRLWYLAILALLLLILILIYPRFIDRKPVINSLAVLPFTSLSAEADQEYFVDGMTDELITHLAKISRLRVISRTSCMRYKGTQKSIPEIARELQVDAVIEGSILRDEDKVRINVQMIEATSDRHLWAESYERELHNILNLQGEVARAVASAIQAQTTVQEQKRLNQSRTVHPEAYENYLKGRYFWNKRTEAGYRKAIVHFRQAITLDSSYAPAFTGLADCYNLLYDYDLLSPREAITAAKAAALKALELDPALADGYASLGFARARYELDWIGAEQEFRRAITLNPNYAIAHHWYALLLAMMGRFNEAQSEIARAQSLDPLSLIINANIGWLYYFARQYDPALEQLQKTLEMEPSFLSTHVKIGWVYEQKRMYPEAVAEFQKALALAGDEVNVMALFGNAYALQGEKAKARKIINELIGQSKNRYVSPYWIAIIYASLGEKDQAFKWLENAFQERSGGVVWLKVEPKLDPLRSDPRFKSLESQLGFDE